MVKALAILSLDGCSTGKVASEQQSDGYYFRDRETSRLVEVSGECFVDYDAPCPAVSVRPQSSAANSAMPVTP